MTPPARRPGGGAGHGGPGGESAPTGSSGDREPIDRGPGRFREADSDRKPRGMQRLADLLPSAARHYGLEDQLEQARVASAWQAMVAERLPAAAGSCRLVDLDHGIATIEADEPIVAQEIRLRTLELLAALRATAGTPVRQLRVTTRHV